MSPTAVVSSELQVLLWQKQCYYGVLWAGMEEGRARGNRYECMSALAAGQGRIHGKRMGLAPDVGRFRGFERQYMECWGLLSCRVLVFCIWFRSSSVWRCRLLAFSEVPYAPLCSSPVAGLPMCLAALYII